MMISVATPYLFNSAYKKNQASSAGRTMPKNNITFKKNAPMTLSDEFIEAANAVLANVSCRMRQGANYDLKNFKNCEARLGELNGSDALYLSTEKIGFIIKLVDGKVDTKSEFYVKNLSEGGLLLADNIPLNGPGAFKKATTMAKNILDTILEALNPKNQKAVAEAAS